MRRMTDRLAVLGAVALCAGTLSAANPFDDVRYWFRGASESGKFIDFAHGATPDHAYHTITPANASYAPPEARRGAVRKNLAAETLVDAPYLHLPQTVTTNRMVAVDDKEYPEVKLEANYLNLPDFLSGLPMPCTEYTVFVRFRQESLVSLKQSVNNFLQLGFRWLSGGGSGISLALQGTTVSRFPVVFVGSQQKAFSSANCTAQIGEWNELAVVVKGQTVGVAACVWGPDADVSRIFAYSEQTCGSAYNPAILAKEAGVRRIGGEQSGTETFVDGNTGTSGNLVKAFRGDVQTYAFWNRALTEAELRAVFNENRPNVTWKGLANGHSEECADWNPVLNAAHPSVTHAFTNDYFSSDLPQVLRVKAVSGSAAACLSATLDGHDLGACEITTTPDYRFYVKGSYLAAGVHTLTVTRTDAGAGDFTIDALTLSGSHRIGNDVSPWGGMEGESYAYQYVNPRILYPEDGNLAHFSRGFSGNSNAIKILPFYVEADVRNDSVFRFHLSQNAQVMTFDVYLNDRKLNATPFATTSESVRYEQKIPAEKLLAGENRLEVRQLSRGWANCSSYEFALGKWHTGVRVILR